MEQNMKLCTVSDELSKRNDKVIRWKFFYNHKVKQLIS